MKPRIAALASLLAFGTAHAHHSAAMFDSTKCESVSGTVRNFQWVYPHTWVWIVVPGANASADAAGDIWGFEFPPSGSLALAPNWSRTALEKGDKVTIYYSPLRDGRHGGLGNTVVLSGTRILHGAPNAFACDEKLWKPGPSGSPIDAISTLKLENGRIIEP
ncbi:MAG TPA: DUF6152 family protein [Dyella sp.]|uniref:DUF6152 family protein n=1 Tax=Dyella sp. TaxID=1869338 RepID=UPI002D78DE65|nr:DUF6152 family protein [Dyella sp.]HET6554994.1 DUF6152 family protein [Dyella sp.]